MLMSGNEKHPWGCPFVGLERVAWDLAIEWCGLYNKGIQPMPWLEMPMWFGVCFKVIGNFEKLEEVNGAT